MEDYKSIRNMLGESVMNEAKREKYIDDAITKVQKKGLENIAKEWSTIWTMYDAVGELNDIQPDSMEKLLTMSVDELAQATRDVAKDWKKV